MSYSTLATASIGLALLAVALGVITGILHLVRRGRWANWMLTSTLVLLAGAAASSFLAGAVSRRDLQAKARRALSLAAVAERAQQRRSGRFTTSVARLRRLSPGLAAAIRLEDARVTVLRGRRTGNVRLRVTLGFGSLAQLTLRPGAHVRRLTGDRPPRSSPARKSAV